MKHILSFDIAKGKSVYCFIDEYALILPAEVPGCGKIQYRILLLRK